MYLGLDLGTSGLRALLVNPTGQTVASATSSYQTSHPSTGWSEQDPQLWVDALDGAITELVAHHPKAVSDVEGIGVSGHMHGAVALDTNGKAQRPCILWNDTRSHGEAAELDATPRVRELSGNIVFPGFTAPKLVWMASHEPDTFARIANVVLPAGFMNHHLTGSLFADCSDSAGTTWLDVGARTWSQPLLDASGMRAEQMPTLVEGCEIGGTLRGALAEKWGMSDRVAVVGGAGDNAAAACGVGVLRDGAGFVSLGTSGVLLCGRNGYAPFAESAVHTFCHAVPNQWYQMGVILAATDSLNWLSRVTGTEPATLANALPDSISGPSSLRFLPYLSGERTPHNDATIRGAFLNIDQATDQTTLTQAVMEGVAFALGDCADALAKTGAQFDSLLAIGGGSASPFWVETLATVLDVPLDVPEAGDFGAALGAARLAMVGCGVGTAEEIMTRPAIQRTIAPRTDLHNAYLEARDAFRASYPALKDLP